MDPGRRQERAGSFGPAAALYDQIRPDYPGDAVRWALASLGEPSDGPRPLVVDIGAGTGIMTRRLLALGYRCVAVEPDELMRARLAAATPEADARAGAAERLPLADASVDGAVAAQAYHWFNRDAAHAELGRVIRPGGVFAPIWNVRDESVPWVREYSRIVEGDRDAHGVAADTGPTDHPSFGDEFGPAEYAEFHHETRHTADTLVALLQSRSYYITAAPGRQADLEAEVRGLAETYPGLAGAVDFPLPYVTRVWRSVRLG